ncbi:SusD/RagB family nutrient-binding outer membrane lipoprotein [Kaistella sp. DKR-2]|uniref:SusD/RagB family nutrient-binding outer membrane lipoprotein n=1 Tax=Kaistella soli TaxID=2849654 RepID=UPI001C257B38|nr:SusD/RagB family nutrient-binding outer membrane lipoprotein [Kaistella soli]MBU8883302.1 SusD/RagB family nutrient-binding outer membrane lipoprotein [Kaistella soli]
MKKYILLSLIGAAMISCRLDDNLTPNKVLTDQVGPNLRLAGASTSAYAVQAGSMNGLGNAWMNSWAGNFAQFGNPFTTESNLDITTTYRQSIFNDMYRAVTRLQRVADYGAAQPNYAAIAKIQKAYYMQYMVDLYGNVPYTEAFQEADNPTPAYDQDVKVYKSLVTELLDAKALITTAGSNPAFKVETTADPIFKGAMPSWTAFANTVLLKFAVRLSNTTNADGIALRNQIITALAGATYITSDVTINPGYSNASGDSQNPLYFNFGRYTYTGASNTNGYLLMTASDHAVKTLQGDASKPTSGVSDSRIGFLFTTGKKYNGVNSNGPDGYYGFPQGMNNEDYKAFMGYPATAIKPAIANFSYLNGPFYDTGANPTGGLKNGYLMLKSESEFLQSEAALRGYAGFSGDQAHFEQGIIASFTFDGKTTDAATYITSIAAKPKVGWTGTNDDKIAAIQYQRWVALMNFNGIESYINYLRTGYPATPLATTATQANKPWRLLYPAAEYSSNTAHVPVVSQGQAFTKNEFTPFIYK